MTMAVDNQQRHLGGLGFDQMQPYSGPPHFTNPWTTSTNASSVSQLFPNPLAPISAPGLDVIPKIHTPTSSSVSMPYTTIPVSAPSIVTSSSIPSQYAQQDLLSLSQDMMNAGRLSATPSYGNEHSFSTAPSPTGNPYAPTSAPYDAVSYSQGRPSFMSPQQQQQLSERRLSQPSLSSGHFLSSPVDHKQRQNSLMDLGRLSQAQQSRETFGDALDASRGMLAMSQNATPRNIYGPRPDRDASNDGYGFPASHSSASSISSASTYPSYYGSVDSSVTDYSSNSESLDVPSRTLPPPSGLLGGNIPPNPQAMMGQFSSKVSTSTQKKHRCKVCEKRFTRPSSLQTHMYSHTGEKPFSCDVEGCGRHFSVVSNLRRHRKVHREDGSMSSHEDY